MTLDEYYAALEKRYKKVDSNNLNSIKAYNRYARELRHQMEEENDNLSKEERR